MKREKREACEQRGGRRKRRKLRVWVGGGGGEQEHALRLIYRRGVPPLKGGRASVRCWRAGAQWGGRGWGDARAGGGGGREFRLALMKSEVDGTVRKKEASNSAADVSGANFFTWA